jgi:hypothetical protein
MMEQDPKTWGEGFKAGEKRKIRCPYAEGSREVWSWSSGYVEGDAKACRNNKYHLAIVPIS